MLVPLPFEQLRHEEELHAACTDDAAARLVLEIMTPLAMDFMMPHTAETVAIEEGLAAFPTLGNLFLFFTFDSERNAYAVGNMVHDMSQAGQPTRFWGQFSTTPNTSMMLAGHTETVERAAQLHN